MSYPRVVVTGLGAVTPIGGNVNEFWDSLVQGKSGVDKIAAFDPRQFDAQIAAEVKNYDPKLTIPLKESRRMERFCQFAVTAALEAFKDSGLDMQKENPREAGVLIGSGIGSLGIVEETHSLYLTKGPEKFSPFMIPMLIINMASGWASILLGLKGPNLSVVTACATGTHAMGKRSASSSTARPRSWWLAGPKAVSLLWVSAGFARSKLFPKETMSPKRLRALLTKNATAL